VDLADRTGGCVKPPGRRSLHTSKPAPTASEIVREAIRSSGLPIRELARRSGVEPSIFSRFVNGQMGISLTTFEKLAPELGLRVTRNARRPAARKDSRL
jgi:transcriptional regulator with XRE-family HTH domain